MLPGWFYKGTEVLNEKQLRLATRRLTLHRRERSVAEPVWAAPGQIRPLSSPA